MPGDAARRRRRRHERKWRHWDELPEGVRVYWRERPGARSGRQRPILVVGADEVTLQMAQLIYDHEGVLIEWHQKYPVDFGHRRSGDGQ